jgi:hypothetical protein
MGSGSFSSAVPSPACGRTASCHNHRRTAHIASENVTAAFPGHDTAPPRFASGRAWNRTATTVYSPSRHGPARRTVLLHRPRVVSNPSAERASSNVVSMCQP